jgi:hypothetical protein
MPTAPELGWPLRRGGRLRGHLLGHAHHEQGEALRRFGHRLLAANHDEDGTGSFFAPALLALDPPETSF